MQDLRQQVEGKSEAIRNLMTLFHAFRVLSDYEATALLARLRLGASLGELMAVVASLQVPDTYAGSSQQDVPYPYPPSSTGPDSPTPSVTQSAPSQHQDLDLDMDQIDPFLEDAYQTHMSRFPYD